MILHVKSKNELIDGIIAYRQILWSKNQEGLQIVIFGYFFWNGWKYFITIF